MKDDMISSQVMKNKTPVVVTARAFSRNPILRSELLDRYETVKFNDTGLALSGQAFVDFVKGFHRAIIALEKINDEVLDHLPELERLSKYGVGLDNIDFSSLARHKVKLGWTGGVNRRSVSELVISLAIAALRHVVLTNRELLDGTWLPRPGAQLSGRTVGVVGCGHIGKDLIPLLQAFGCSVLVHDIRDYPEFFARHSLTPISLEQLLRNADIVTLHVPHNETTHQFINEERLSWMKPGAVLINTARGNLVNEVALKRRLKDGMLRAAAFDVYSVEPPTDNELLSLPNFIGTPHIGGSSEEAILAMGRAAISGLDEAVPVEQFPLS